MGVCRDATPSFDCRRCCELPRGQRDKENRVTGANDDLGCLTNCAERHLRSVMVVKSVVEGFWWIYGYHGFRFGAFVGWDGRMLGSDELE